MEQNNMLCEYTVVRCQRKSVGLKMTKEGILQIRAPHWVPDAEIARIVESKASWILQKQQLVQELNAAEAIKPDLDTITYLGIEYPVEHIQDTWAYIHFTDHLIVSNLGTEQLRQNLPRWYQHHGIFYIKSRVLELSKLHNFYPQGVKITNAVRKWGSCSNAGRLCFSWRLLMAPPEVIDYVIVHELTHLVHYDHSAAFWNHVQSIVPDYKIHYQWLRVNGKHLKV